MGQWSMCWGLGPASDASLGQFWLPASHSLVAQPCPASRSPSLLVTAAAFLLGEARVPCRESELHIQTP